MSLKCNPFHEKPECELLAGTNKVFVAKDSGAISEYRLENPNQRWVVKLKVDGCLIPSDSQKKCDFLFLACEKEGGKTAYFVELKGGNLGDAIEQIQSAIEILYPKLTDFSFRCRIVQTKTPPMRIINQKKEALLSFLKKTKFAVNVKNSKITDLIQIQSTPHKETI
ncbi:hypothetical protein [Runella slithyformis]|uniref:Uncharacterized protein n=1 Tax=Runella slithyformis (strain ATCC 29530 / DSM 19594 / LMG 11500 / NCIMB 11436 / LSU 4) TaxID=761193 RepID=A0A7U3ZHX1_RUNSL|nr:hypothetical protein [Runella slithyformis]AEI47495.1 hypothetical protein Runsl_1064 [Runella slithyformis DSM 19594]